MKVLTISMANISRNGYYRVKCGGNVGFTNNVSVTVLVRPSAPAFKGLQDIDECKECIVGSDKEYIEVHCKTSGGTQPIDVNVTVGDKQINALQHNTSVYKALITLNNSYHNTTVTCAVMNSALTSPLFTTAKVYVIKPPAKVVLSTPSFIKEGSPVNITCQSQNSRPSPIVYLTISGVNVSPTYVNTIPTFNKETLLYNNTTTLTTFKREWNRKDIICCSCHKWYNIPRYCSSQEQVKFLFPPSDIKLEIKFDSVDPLHMYAVCTLNNSNPVCRAYFTAASRIIGSEMNSSNTSLLHCAWKTKYVVHLNVSKEDDGKEVTCAAFCADFQDMELRDTKTIKVPYRPVIKFDISGPMLSITKGEKAQVKCIADSYPASNISWIEMTNKKDKVKKQCDYEKECVLDVNADVISEQYFMCAIRYLQFQDYKTLIVNIHEPDSVDFINVILIAGICSALLVIVVIVVLIIRDKRNNDQAKHDTVLERNSLPLRENEYIETTNDVADADDQQEVTYSQPIKKQKVATVCDDTYAEVDKTRNKKQPATCSATESQRTEDGQLMYVDLEF
ncbi:uncharacterized protein LOC132730819, partial [Ruditapes philippinarum]|uniref:uncharacterized protein LOC132730819 n=1 Tax=Ruditapes philippinarum TaxID=129788 RepID=UPI00295ABFA1